MTTPPKWPYSRSLLTVQISSTAVDRLISTQQMSDNQENTIQLVFTVSISQASVLYKKF